jgi:mannitol-1-/sugar-/sorbitol-6-/2-deoxyglucose-6-phosphatase
MYEAVIFDMDGLLIDSEPLWQQAEIAIFGKLGMELTVELCEQVQGQKIEDVIKHWYNYKPWINKSFKEVEIEIINMVQGLIKEKAQPMLGIEYILDFFKKKNFKIGLASSSTMNLIDTALDKLNIRHYFDVIHSSQFEKFGKPSPDVYLTVAEKLQLYPEKCIVFEDSYNGLLAARSAGMIAVAVPVKHSFDNPKFDIANLKIKSLLDFDEGYFLLLQNEPYALMNK